MCKMLLKILVTAGYFIRNKTVEKQLKVTVLFVMCRSFKSWDWNKHWCSFWAEVVFSSLWLWTASLWIYIITGVIKYLSLFLHNKISSHLFLVFDDFCLHKYNNINIPVKACKSLWFSLFLREKKRVDLTTTS